MQIWEIAIDSSGDYVRSVHFTGASRVAGDALAGTYQVTVTLPEFGAPGNWRLDGLVTDADDNTRQYSPNPGGVPFPVPANMVVTAVNSGTANSEPPAFTSSSVSPAQADTSSSPAVFTFTIEGGNWFASKMAAAAITGNDALPGADPDHDGKTNAEEVASNGNPAVPDGPGFSTIQRTPTHLYLAFELDPSLTVGTSSDYLTLGDGSLQPLRLTGEIQHGLTGAWTRVLPEALPPNTWRVDIPLAAGANGFVRLRSENP